MRGVSAFNLAGLPGIPTLSFMGPTVKDRWSPLGRNSIVLRRDGIPCIGCNRGTCRTGARECMTGISPDRAYDGYVRLTQLWY